MAAPGELLLWDPLTESVDTLARDLRSARVSVCVVTGDLFSESVTDEQRAAAWDAMWSHANVSFRVVTQRIDAAHEWTRNHACRRGFGYWSPGEGPPMRPGDTMPLSVLFGRRRCGWANTSSGYGCDHPAAVAPDGHGECFPHTCPIADDEDDPEAPEDPDMRLHTRPRDAFAANVAVSTRVKVRRLTLAEVAT